MDFKEVKIVNCSGTYDDNVMCIDLLFDNKYDAEYDTIRSKNLTQFRILSQNVSLELRTILLMDLSNPKKTLDNFF